jgi:hypothetical protein
MWPPEALEFLRELEDNNDREWFRANRNRYDRDLMAPGQALAGELEAFGTPRFFRPYRDTRFRPGPELSGHRGLARHVARARLGAVDALTKLLASLVEMHEGQLVR